MALHTHERLSCWTSALIHTRRAERHARHRQTNSIGAFLHQATDIVGGHMSLDHITVHERRVAGDHPLRNAVNELEAHEKPCEHVRSGRREIVFFKMLHPSEATAAAIGLENFDRRFLGERSGNRKNGKRE